MSSPALDVHAHLWLDSVEAVAASDSGYANAVALELYRFGAESVTESAASAARVRDKLTDPAARLAAMDEVGVDVQLVSVAPTQYHPWAEADLALELSSLTNAGVAAHCATAADRLLGLGVVPLQCPERAVTALEDAVLGHGLRGVEISSHAPDPHGGTVELSDRRLDAFWDRAEQLRAVVFLHPWGCTLDARLNSWYFGNYVGQPVEHAVALSHLIISGVLDRHPELRLVAAHGGGYLPTFMGRADHAWRYRRDARGCRELPSSYLQRMWFDSLVHTPDALRRLVDAVGERRVVLGSDFPFDMGDSDPIGKVRAAGLTETVQRAIIADNARDLGLIVETAAARHA